MFKNRNFLAMCLFVTLSHALLPSLAHSADELTHTQTSAEEIHNLINTVRQDMEPFRLGWTNETLLRKTTHLRLDDQLSIWTEFRRLIPLVQTDLNLGYLDYQLQAVIEALKQIPLQARPSTVKSVLPLLHAQTSAHIVAKLLGSISEVPHDQRPTLLTQIEALTNDVSLDVRSFLNLALLECSEAERDPTIVELVKTIVTRHPFRELYVEGDILKVIRLLSYQTPEQRISLLNQVNEFIAENYLKIAFEGFSMILENLFTTENQEQKLEILKQTKPFLVSAHDRDFAPEVLREITSGVLNNKTRNIRHALTLHDRQMGENVVHLIEGFLSFHSDHAYLYRGQIERLLNSRAVDWVGDVEHVLNVLLRVGPDQVRTFVDQVLKLKHFRMEDGPYIFNALARLRPPQRSNVFYFVDRLTVRYIEASRDGDQQIMANIIGRVAARTRAGQEDEIERIIADLQPAHDLRTVLDLLEDGPRIRQAVAGFRERGIHVDLPGFLGAAPNTINVHDGNRDPQTYAALRLLLQYQHDVSEEEISRAYQKFEAFLSSWSNTNERETAQVVLTNTDPARGFSGLLETRVTLLPGHQLSGRQLLGRLWIFAERYVDENEREAIKAGMIGSLVRSYQSGNIACDQGKTQGLVLAVLQGRLPGVDVDEERPLTIAQYSDVFFSVTARREMNADDLRAQIPAFLTALNGAVDETQFRALIEEYIRLQEPEEPAKETQAEPPAKRRRRG